MEFVEKPRYLVVESNGVHLQHLAQSFGFLDSHATFCTTQEEALLELGDRTRRYDIILVDDGMDREAGFEFLTLVTSQMEIPIIMMSSAYNGELFAEWMNRGARECVVKPVQASDLHRFGQEALKKSGSERVDGGNSVMTNGLQYKTRFVWTEGYHSRFVMAVDLLGGAYKAVPSKILKLMAVPGLTREHVASHLQKYRLSMDPNKPAGKRKRRSSLVIDEQAAAVHEHGNQQHNSFEALEFNPYAQNVMEQPIIGAEGNSRWTYGVVPDPSQVYLIDTPGNQQGIPFLQFPSYGNPGVMPNYSLGLNFEASMPLESDLPGLVDARTLNPTFGPPNGHQVADYPLGQPEMGNSVLSAQMDTGVNDPATDSLVSGNNVDANSSMAMHHPQQQGQGGWDGLDLHWPGYNGF